MVTWHQATALDFNAPTVNHPTVATAYAQELLKELQKARAIAKTTSRKLRRMRRDNMIVGL